MDFDVQGVLFALTATELCSSFQHHASERMAAKEEQKWFLKWPLVGVKSLCIRMHATRYSK